ncbi:MAG: DUF2232 domain-containing protein [Smithella sp.]|nr:DUF2232 domain-containing protein [Smithella sp.]
MSRLFSWNDLKTAPSDNSFPKYLPFISVFVYAGIFVPLIGPLLIIFLPSVLFINASLNGLSGAAKVFFGSYFLLLLVALLLQIHVPAIGIFALGTAGLLMSQMARVNSSVEKTVMYPALFMVGVIGLNFIYDAAALSSHPWEIVKNYIAASVAEGVEFYSKMPLKAEDIELIKTNQKAITEGFVRIFPSLVVISSLLAVWVNFLLGRNILVRLGVLYPKLVTLARWRSPEKVIWIFIIAGALLFLPYQGIVSVSLNVFLVMCFVYLLQGLAIISFLFQNKNVPAFFRYLFYFLIAVQQFLMIPIIALGLFDIWIDFRKVFQKNQTAD